MRRRDLIMGLLGFGWATLRPGKARAAELRIPLSKLPMLQELGGNVRVNIKGRPILFVRESARDIRAVDPTCTHEQCPVRYRDGFLKCKCHKSTFGLGGERLSGPAKRSLTAYATRIEGDNLIVSMPD